MYACIYDTATPVTKTFDPWAGQVCEWNEDGTAYTLSDDDEAEWGTYTYDVIINKVDSNDNVVDVFAYKWPYCLTIASDPVSGHKVWIASGENGDELRCFYCLNDYAETYNYPNKKLPQKLKLTPIDDKLNERNQGIQGGTQLGTRYDNDGNGILVYQESLMNDVWRVLFIGEDGCWNGYRRDHELSRMIAVNGHTAKINSYTGTSKYIVKVNSSHVIYDEGKQRYVGKVYTLQYNRNAKEKGGIEVGIMENLQRLTKIGVFRYTYAGNAQEYYEDVNRRFKWDSFDNYGQIYPITHDFHFHEEKNTMPAIMIAWHRSYYKYIFNPEKPSRICSHFSEGPAVFPAHIYSSYLPDDFTYDPAVEQTQQDRALKYTLMGVAQSLKGSYPDGAQVLYHYLTGGGNDLWFDFEKAYRQDRNIKYGVDMEIRGIQEAAKRVYAQTHKRSFSLKGADVLIGSRDVAPDGTIINFDYFDEGPWGPATINWRGIGSFRIWTSADVTVDTKGDFTMQIAVHGVDRFNFDRGKTTYGIRDEDLGRLVVVGLAHNFWALGTIERTVHFQAGGFALEVLSD